MPTEPYLVLVHNDFLNPKAKYYNSAEENALFEKMLEAVWQIHPSLLLVREILRCHFAPDNLSEPANLENCFTHLRRDLETARYRGILLVGKAASLVFPEKIDLEKRQDAVFEWQGLPAMVCPGPNRLVYMREKKFAKEQIDSERQKIFATLTTFRDKIIRAP